MFLLLEERYWHIDLYLSLHKNPLKEIMEILFLGVDYFFLGPLKQRLTSLKKCNHSD